MLLRRTIHPEIRVLDEKRGLAEYIASDETVDSYREIIRANGWRFDRFQKNAPLVDSHDYSTIEKLVGKVVDFSVKANRLIETAQWAIDVEGNQLAQIGWAMTKAGYLRAVSVGFQPEMMVNRWDSEQAPWRQQLDELGLKEDQTVRTIYTQQQQLELSVVIIGANPNAVARSFKEGLISEADLTYLSNEVEKSVRGSAPEDSPAEPPLASPDQLRFLDTWLTNVWELCELKPKG